MDQKNQSGDGNLCDHPWNVNSKYPFDEHGLSIVTHEQVLELKRAGVVIEFGGRKRPDGTNRRF